MRDKLGSTTGFHRPVNDFGNKLRFLLMMMMIWALGRRNKEVIWRSLRFLFLVVIYRRYHSTM